MSPQRIQLKRTKGWRIPPGTVIVDRRSNWGNPYKVGELIRDPANSSNPVATNVSPSFSQVGTYKRTDFYGKPYTITVRRIVDAADAVGLFRRLCVFEGFDMSSIRGKNLACWCPLDAPCHADVLLELANVSAGGESNT